MNHAFDNRTDFDAAFVDSTALPGILRRTGISGPRWARRYAWTTWEVNLLANLPPYPSPKFVFGHLLLPHTPYIFTADGGFVSDEANRDRPRTKQFTEQLTFTNARMLAIIDDLLAVPETERPVIIVQADEGPYPSYLEDETRHDWTTATLEEREIKFGILNAWYVPDGRDIGLYPEIAPVNTFRLLVQRLLRHGAADPPGRELHARSPGAAGVPRTIGRPSRSYAVADVALRPPPTCSARRSSQVRRPTARSGARLAPPRTAAAALPPVGTGTISRCLPLARR